MKQYSSAGQTCNKSQNVNRDNTLNALPVCMQLCAIAVVVLCVRVCVRACVCVHPCGCVLEVIRKTLHEVLLCVYVVSTVPYALGCVYILLTL